jgi:hypothetical protein
MVIGSLVTNVVADLSKWGPNLTKARGQMAQFARDMSTLQTVISGVVSGVAANFVLQMVDMGSALHDTASLLKVNVESLQRYRFAIEQVGGSASRLERNISMLNRMIGKASLGDGAAIGIFQRLGLDPSGLASMGTDRALMGSIEAISKLSSATEQAAITAQLFGKSSQDILLAARNLKEFREQMGKIDPVTSKAVGNLEAIGDEVNSLKTGFSNLGMEIVGTFGPVLLPFVENAQNQIKSLKATLWDFPWELWREMRGYTVTPTQTPTLPGAPPIGVNFPGNPALNRPGNTANFPGNPALNPNFGQLPGQSPVAIDANQKEFMQGINRVFNALPGRLQGAIMQGMGAKLPAPVENFFQGIGKFIGQGGLMANPAKALGMVPGFDLARSGSAESYRQQVRIERQGSGNNKLEQVGNKQLVAQQGMLGELRAIAKSVKDGGVQLVAANFGG